jgi:hypothetical protein
VVVVARYLTSYKIYYYNFTLQFPFALCISGSWYTTYVHMQLSLFSLSRLNLLIILNICTHSIIWPTWPSSGVQIPTAQNNFLDTCKEIENYQRLTKRGHNFLFANGLKLFLTLTC